MADDNEVSVVISSQTDSLEAGAQRSAQAISAAARLMTYSINDYARAQAAVGDNIKTQITWLDKEAAALKNAATETKGVVTAMQTLINSGTGVTRVMRDIEKETQSAAQSARVFSEAIKGADSNNIMLFTSMEKANESISGAGNAANTASGHFRVGAGSMREFIVIGHEMMTGNFARIPGSLVVLAERMNGLHAIVGMLTPGWIALGAAGAAALGGIAYYAYQAYEGMRAVQGTQLSLGMLGQGQQFSTKDITAWRDELVTVFGESEAGARHVMDAFNKLPSAASAARPQLFQLAEALARINKESSATTAETVAKAAEGGATAFGKWAEKTAGLEGQIVANNRTLSAQVAILVESGRESEAYQLILNTLAIRFTNVGVASAKAAADLKAFIAEYAEIIALGSIPPGEPDISALKPDASKMGQRRPEALITSAIVAEKATPEDEHRNRLQNEINSLKKGEEELEKAINAAVKEGNQEEQKRLALELLRNREGQANRAAELPKIHGAGEEREHAIKMAQYDEELRVNQRNAAAIVGIRQNMQREIARYSGAGSPEAIKAQGEVLQAENNVARETLRVTIDGLREKAAALRAGSAERIDIERQVQTRLQEGERAGIVTAQEVAQQRIRISTAIRENTQHDYQVFADHERLKVQEAKGGVGQIIAIYDEWLSALRGKYSQDAAEFERVQRDKVRAVQQAYQQAFQEASQALTAQSTMNRLEQSAAERNLRAMVDARQITTQQFEGFALQIYTQHYELLKKELEALRDAENTTRQERQQTVIKLAELDDQYAAKRAQVGERIAAADKAALEKQLQDYKTFFSSAGSALEQFVSAGVLRTSTFAAASKSLFSSLGQSALKLAGDQLSQWGAKQLAGTFGVQLQPGEGFGALFSHMIGNWLGLSPEKSAQQLQADATKANTTSTEANTTAINQFTQSVGTLNSKIVPEGPGSGKAGRSYDSKASGGPINLHGGPINMVGSGESRLTNPMGKPIDTDDLRRLQSSIAEGSRSLPSGYHAEITSTERPGDSGYHGRGAAMDVKIVDASGLKIANEGADTTGLYERLAVASYRANSANYPGTNFTWGGRFGTEKGGGGEDDLMHYDSGRDRGTRGPSMADRSAAYGPIKVDPETVKQGVTQGMDEAKPAISDGVQQGSQQGTQQGVATGNQTLNTTNQQLNQRTTDEIAALNKNTDGLREAKSGTSSGGGHQAGPGAGGDSTPGVLGAGTNVLSSLGRFIPGLGSLGSMISGIQSAVKSIQSLGQAVGPAVSSISTLSSAATTASAATQLTGVAMTGTAAASTGAATATTTETGIRTVNTTATTANSLATTINSAATEANSAAQGASAAGSGAGGLLKLIPIIGSLFEQGGVVPSAAGGMVAGLGRGAFPAILHAREMVLPARLSEGIQSAINNGSFGGGGGQGGQSSTNNNASINYSPTINAGAANLSRGQVQAILRNHGSEIMSHASNLMRNGWRP